MHSDNCRISAVHPLIPPAVLAEDIPLSAQAANVVGTNRRAIEAILAGDDHRLLVIVGPCSIHDSAAALEYAGRLKLLAEQISERMLVVMRVYFEKPRTVIGWKGLINDPDLDGSYRINKGLLLARQLLADIADLGLGAGTEFLDTTLSQFYTDLICWGAIGARTAESQVHRALASGLSMPVGIKNRTDGNIQVAVDAIKSARTRHFFPSLTNEGTAAIVETTGNPHCHLVLRGGSQTGPNYTAPHISTARLALEQAGLPQIVMVDCSHGNSEKTSTRQPMIAEDLLKQITSGEASIRALMLESHLIAGHQSLVNTPLTYGQSVTDACLGFEATAELLMRLAGP